MKPALRAGALLCAGLALASCTTYRTITVDDYTDKMRGGWVGKMCGVGWGGPTEFRSQGVIMPVSAVPPWKPELVNQFDQDDLYVEMTFLETLERYGLDVPIRQAGIDFANSRYPLWHANRIGRENLRGGIAPPWSGHPQNNGHTDDIDYQIEADFSGLIAPGLPQTAIDLGRTFGGIMNYGDGIYAGQFVGGMYAEAFFEKDREKIVAAGLRCIPEESIYYRCIADVLRWYREDPKDWQRTWRRIDERYRTAPGARPTSCSPLSLPFDIDVWINGAYAVMGLLYGNGDPDSTIVIAMRGGQDSDCNPATAAGVLFTTMGYRAIPERFTRALDDTAHFSFTTYTMPHLTEACVTLARTAVVRSGGRIAKSDTGAECFMVPVRTPSPDGFVPTTAPGPVAVETRYTPSEMAQIRQRSLPLPAAITDWSVAGPYRLPGVDGKRLFDVAFAPEQGADSVVWTPCPVGRSGFKPRSIELAQFSAGDDQVMYMRTQFWSDTTISAILWMGSDDGVKAWFNGALVHANNIARGYAAEQDAAGIMVQKGWNTCMLKITQGGGGWEASASITDANDRPIRGDALRGK
jgi:hypothetical protein